MCTGRQSVHTSFNAVGPNYLPRASSATSSRPTRPSSPSSQFPLSPPEDSSVERKKASRSRMSKSTASTSRATPSLLPVVMVDVSSGRRRAWTTGRGGGSDGAVFGGCGCGGLSSRLRQHLYTHPTATTLSSSLSLPPPGAAAVTEEAAASSSRAIARCAAASAAARYIICIDACHYPNERINTQSPHHQNTPAPRAAASTRSHRAAAKRCRPQGPLPYAHEPVAVAALLVLNLLLWGCLMMGRPQRKGMRGAARDRNPY